MRLQDRIHCHAKASQNVRTPARNDVIKALQVLYSRCALGITITVFCSQRTQRLPPGERCTVCDGFPPTKMNAGVLCSLSACLLQAGHALRNGSSAARTRSADYGGISCTFGRFISTNGGFCRRAMEVFCAAAKKQTKNGPHFEEPALQTLCLFLVMRCSFVFSRGQGEPPASPRQNNW